MRDQLLVVMALLAHAMSSLAGDKKDDAPFVVPVSKPIQRSVTDFADCTGRACAKDDVTIQPRVTGYLVKIAFKEGSQVKAGDVLFEIDPISTRRWRCRLLPGWNSTRQIYKPRC